MTLEPDVRHESESRIRITFFLPCRGKELESAAKNVLHYLKTEGTKPAWIGGLTHSPIEGPVFEGLFWGKNKAGEPEPVADGVAMVIIDCQPEPKDKPTFSTAEWSAELAERIHLAYAKRPQEEVWISVQRIEVHRSIRPA